MKNIWATLSHHHVFPVLLAWYLMSLFSPLLYWVVGGVCVGGGGADSTIHITCFKSRQSSECGKRPTRIQFQFWRLSWMCYSVAPNLGLWSFCTNHWLVVVSFSASRLLPLLLSLCLYFGSEVSDLVSAWATIVLKSSGQHRTINRATAPP